MPITLKTAKNYNAYDKFINDNFLKQVFAETKILNGIGDMEQWYSMMNPAQYQALKERIDLEFAVTDKRFFATDEPVSLDLYIKNINTLIVKIFELNTFSYYQTNLKEVDTAVNLDGLTANSEQVVTYNDPPLRRIQRKFELNLTPLPPFPEGKGETNQDDLPFPSGKGQGVRFQNKRGIYVAEFIGNGKSSRAVIRKGKLFAVENIGTAGHEFRILNEMNQICPQAAIWLSGREFKTNNEGIIIIPFSTNPGKQTMILKDNDFCSLSSFEHLSENYTLSAGFYADRESLLKRLNSKVIIRPVLAVNGHPVTLSLLENIRLMIETTDQDGVTTGKEISDFQVFDDKESVFDFQVPENLQHIRFTLKSQIQNISQNKKEDLSDQSEFSLNQIDTNASVDDMFLSHISDGYVLDVLGKNGEPKADRPVQVELKHRYFRDTVFVPLQTDDKGEIRFGKLEDIEGIKATGSEGNSHIWYPAKNFYHYPANIHGNTKETIQIPISHIKDLRGFGNPAGLLEKRGETYTADHKDKIKIQNGFIEIKGLDAGDYDLFLKDNGVKITLRLTDSRKQKDLDDFVISENRVLERKNNNPLQISNIEISETAVKVKLSNISEFTRVHLFATRFMPDFHPFSHLDQVNIPEPYEMKLLRPESQYVEGRNIGDEYRYILDRKYAEKFSGNMLNRPELLLNPWSIRDTETAKDEATAGDAFSAEMPAETGIRREAKGRGVSGREGDTGYSNLDFLAETSAILVNLKPDKNGVIIIDRKNMGNHQQIHFAAIDPFNTVYKEISLPRKEIKKRDLRLIQGLDTEKHFTEQKEISFVSTGEAFVLSDITTSEFELYDSLDKVYNLLSTLSGDATLQEFSFILQWNTMTDAEKQEKYSKYACHELSFFIYQKDKEFFDRVIFPYLADKKDKTFPDNWLLGDDLTSYLDPWAFSQLNIAEKILLRSAVQEIKSKSKDISKICMI